MTDYTIPTVHVDYNCIGVGLRERNELFSRLESGPVPKSGDLVVARCCCLAAFAEVVSVEDMTDAGIEFVGKQYLVVDVFVDTYTDTAQWYQEAPDNDNLAPYPRRRRRKHGNAPRMGDGKDE